MSCLLITYDLNQPGQKYEDLYEVIKSMGAWWHHLDSTWLVSTNLTVGQAAEKLRKVTDESDNFLVIDVTKDPRQGWLEQGAWDWINKHM